jgi:ParB family chromosome partitioning protein
MSDEAPARRRPGALGRGLSSLLGEVAHEAPVEGGGGRGGLQTVPVASIEPNPGQPRRAFNEEALAELAESIKARGVIQPIVVRPHNGRYQIVAGERRWRAAQRARLHEMPAIVRELDDEQTLEIALIENIQRQDLNAIEEAKGYRRLAEEFGHTQEELGRLVSKSRSHVANLLRLLELPDGVQELVASGRLSMGHARALIPAEDPESLADDVVKRGLSVRETEKLVRGGRARQLPLGPMEYTGASADVAALERQLGDMLGLNVAIRHGPKGGAVTLAYSTLDQLDMICQRLSGEKI